MADYDDSEDYDMTDLGVLVPRLEPYFGNRPHTPYGRCPCGGRGFRKGSVFCCMGPKCHKSGKDHLRYFRAVNRPKVLEALPPDDTLSKPTKYVPLPKPGEKECRRERRARQFGHQADDRQAS